MGYRYSPIKRIFIRNFRCLSEASLTFEKSPIMCFIGENEAGKTSAVKAITVLGLNAWVREQAGYIRNGTSEFDVGVELEDGTCIARIKTKGKYNIYKINYPDGTSWETDKISEGLPVQVQEVMGMIEEQETGELLHTRTYENQLMFVTTPLSANYKVMYNALKVKNLTSAIKIGSLESNELKQRINNNEYLIQNQSFTLKNIVVIDTEPLQDIKENISKLTERIEKLRRAMNISGDIAKKQHELGVLKLIGDFNLQEIDVKSANDIIRAGRVIEELKKLTSKKQAIACVSELKPIEIKGIDKLRRAINSKKKVEETRRSLEAIEGVEGLSSVDDRVVVRLEKALQSRNRLIELNKRLSEIDTRGAEQIDLGVINKIEQAVKRLRNLEVLSKELEDTKSNINEHEVKLKNSGARIETCPNCGTDIVIVEEV